MGRPAALPRRRLDLPARVPPKSKVVAGRLRPPAPPGREPSPSFLDGLPRHPRRRDAPRAARRGPARPRPPPPRDLGPRRPRDQGRPLAGGDRPHGARPRDRDRAERGRGSCTTSRSRWPGRTSEDVEAGLGTGAFGMARETGEEVNRAIVEGDRDGLGLGAAVGRLPRRRAARARATSTRASSRRRGGSACRATVHVAIGTDIVHVHPACDPGALGRATHLDFRTLRRARSPGSAEAACT